MAEYKSSYTGAQIDEGIAKANTAIQPKEYTKILDHTIQEGEYTTSTYYNIPTDLFTGYKNIVLIIDIAAGSTQNAGQIRISLCNFQITLGNAYTNGDRRIAIRFWEDGGIVFCDGQGVNTHEMYTSNPLSGINMTSSTLTGGYVRCMVGTSGSPFISDTTVKIYAK